MFYAKKFIKNCLFNKEDDEFLDDDTKSGKIFGR